MTAVRLHLARSLRGKLVSLFVAAGLVPLCVVGVISYRQAAGELHRSAGARLADVAFDATDKIDRNLFERYGDVQAFAKSDAARSLEPSRLSRWMDTMMATYTPIYQLMVVADTTGNVIAANSVGADGRPLDTSSLSGLNVASASWFRQAIGGRLRDGETLVEDLHRDPLMEKVFGDGARSYAMSFTYPIRDDGGQIIGVWTNRFNWSVVEDILGAAADRAQEHGMRTLGLTLVNRRGTVLSGGRPEDVLVRSVAGSPVVRRALRDGANGYAESERLHRNGSRQLQGYYHSVGYSTYPGTGWSVIASQDVSEALAAAAALRTRTVVVALLAAVLLAVSAFLVARRLSRPLEELVVATEAAATGDLTVRASAATRRDELGRLARGFDTMIENLAQLVGRISGTSVTLSGSAEDVASNSGQVGASIEEIAHAVGGVAQGAERQVRLLDEARRAAEEMGMTVNASARRARDSAAAADEARAATEEGVAAAERATEAVQGVRESSAVVSRAIDELAAKSEQIGSIVETITGIAAQTNLLALNAAIEAARAGDHGRGFAVVAEQVRKLAEDARRAAEMIAELVAQTQAETQRVVEVVSEGARRAEDGAATVEAARIAFLQIGRSVDEASGRAAEIAAAAQQLSAGAARVQEGMAEVAGVAEQSSASTQQVSASTQQTSATMQAISASAHGLAATADELALLVGRFKLDA